MNRFKNLTGQIFNNLKVISSTNERDRNSGSMVWICSCMCGNTTKATTKDLTTSHKKSCGCIKPKSIRFNSTKHGHAKHAKNRSPEYRSYTSMKVRCYNKKYHAYHRYGGRGIAVCNRWLESFANFLSDMGNRPAGTSLDRYPNPDGNYEPSNCRWATINQQRNNRGTTGRPKVLAVSKTETTNDSGG